MSRHRRPSAKAIVLTLTIALVGIVAIWSPLVFLQSDEPSRSKPPQLSLQQTIGAAFLNPEPDGYFVFHRANPSARKYLLQILSNERLHQFHVNSLMMLGYVGDESDVPRLEKLIREKYQGVLTNEEAGCVKSALLALGLLSGRNVEGATKTLELMLDEKYWRGVEFRWHEKRIEELYPFKYESFVHTMYGMWLANKEGLDKVCATFLARIEDKNQRRDYSIRLSQRNRQHQQKREVSNAPDSFLEQLDVLYRMYASAYGLTVSDRDEISDDDRLSVIETLGAALTRPSQNRHELLKCYALANRRAKRPLLRILNHEKLVDYHINVICMLGYIGDGDDVRLLERLLLERYLVPIEQAKAELAAAALMSFGRLAQSGVMQANDTLDAMLKLDYWSQERFRHEDVPAFPYEMIVHVANAATIARKGNLNEICDRIAGRMPEDIRKKYGPKLRERTRLSVTVGPTDYDLPIAFRKMLRKRFNGDFDYPRPVPTRLELEESASLAIDMITHGDCEVVPVLLSWLERDWRDRSADGLSFCEIAVRGVGEFRVKEGIALLTQLYRKSNVPAGLRKAAAEAIAKTGDDSTVAILKQILQEDVIPKAERGHIAKGLVQLDLDVGREFLLEIYDTYLMQLEDGTSRNSAPFGVLSQMSDEKTLRRLLERKIQMADGIALRNVEALITRLQLNALPVEELIAIAKDDRFTPERIDQRIQAIQAIGTKGGVTLVKELRQLPLWRTKGSESLSGDRGQIQARQESLRREIAQAVGKIKRRHWTTGSANQGVAIKFPEERISGELEPKAAHLFVSAAITEFEKMKDMLVRRKYGEVIRKLLDNGEPIEIEKVESDEILHAKLTRSLAHTRECILALNKRKLKYTGFLVQRETDGIGHDSGVVVVKFKLKDSKNVAEEFFPNGNPDSTFSSDGSFVVVMKQVGREWYWNPFGW